MTSGDGFEDCDAEILTVRGLMGLIHLFFFMVRVKMFVVVVLVMSRRVYRLKKILTVAVFFVLINVLRVVMDLILRVALMLRNMVIWRTVLMIQVLLISVMILMFRMFFRVVTVFLCFC